MPIREAELMGGYMTGGMPRGAATEAWWRAAGMVAARRMRMGASEIKPGVGAPCRECSSAASYADSNRFCSASVKSDALGGGTEAILKVSIEGAGTMCPVFAGEGAALEEDGAGRVFIVGREVKVGKGVLAFGGDRKAR